MVSEYEEESQRWSGYSKEEEYPEESEESKEESKLSSQETLESFLRWRLGRWFAMSQAMISACWLKCRGQHCEGSPKTNSLHAVHADQVHVLTRLRGQDQRTFPPEFFSLPFPPSSNSCKSPSFLTRGLAKSAHTSQIAAAAETEFVNVPSSAGERPEYYVGGGHRQCTRWTLRIRIRGKRFPPVPPPALLGFAETPGLPYPRYPSTRPAVSSALSFRPTYCQQSVCPQLN